MDILNIPKPELVTPIKYAYSVTNLDMERFDRKKKRAEEIGINLFILDEENIPEELKELEYYIMDNFLDLDKDIPEDIKIKYQGLKNRLVYNEQQEGYLLAKETGYGKHKTEGDLKLAGLEHYYDPNDMNAVIYHKRLEDEDDRIQTILG